VQAINLRSPNCIIDGFYMNTPTGGFTSGLTYLFRSDVSKYKNQIFGQQGWHKS